jgi:hypothetical protein
MGILKMIDILTYHFHRLYLPVPMSVFSPEMSLYSVLFPNFSHPRYTFSLKMEVARSFERLVHRTRLHSATTEKNSGNVQLNYYLVYSR